MQIEYNIMHTSLCTCTAGPAVPYLSEKTLERGVPLERGSSCRTPARGRHCRRPPGWGAAGGGGRMDRAALEYTQRHYDGHARAFGSDADALRARSQGPGFPLKQYHNQVKRQLVQHFARNTAALLDLACGRGGDLQKWADAGVRPTF